MIFFTHCYTISFNKGNYKRLSLSSPITPNPHQLGLPPLITPPTTTPNFTLDSSHLLLELEEMDGYDNAVEVTDIETSQISQSKEEVEIANDEGIEIADEGDQGLLK